MLDAVVDFLPSPLDIPPTQGTNLRGDEVVTREADDKAPFAALAFKIVADPFGKLTYFRVYSGTINKGDEVYNSIKEQRERLGRILLMHANQREDLDVALAGDIVAGLGFKDTTTGDTLCDRSDPDHPRADGVPRAGHPRRHRAEDEERPGQARQGAQVAVRRGPDVPRPHRRGDRPDRHLRAWASCTSRCSSTACSASSPSRRRSASRRWPTARRSPRPSSRSSTATSSRPVAPASSPWSRSRSSRTRARATSSPTRSRGGRIPREYIQPTNQGIQAALDSGVLAGYPTVDVKATPRRRPVPRRRLVGDGVQDRRPDGVPQGRRDGQAGAARADHVGRGRHARGVHGRRDGRPVQPARPHRRHGGPGQHPGRARPRCRCRRCSGTVPTSVRAPRAGRRTRCSSTATSRCRTASPPRSSSECAASRSPPALSRSLTTHDQQPTETLESAPP